MTKTELLALARNLGCRGNLSKMSKNELADVINKRRAYLKVPASDIPKTRDHACHSLVCHPIPRPEDK